MISFLNTYVCWLHRTLKSNLCESSQQRTSSKVLTMPHQQGIFRRSDSKKKQIALTLTSRVISFHPSSNNIPLSPP